MQHANYPAFMRDSNDVRNKFLLLRNGGFSPCFVRHFSTISRTLCLQICDISCRASFPQIVLELQPCLGLYSFTHSFPSESVELLRSARDMGKKIQHSNIVVPNKIVQKPVHGTTIGPHDGQPWSMMNEKNCRVIRLYVEKKYVESGYQIFSHRHCGRTVA